MTRNAAPDIAAEPMALRTGAWDDYGLIDSGAGRKLERFGPYRVVRPEPQCLWRPTLADEAWTSADAVFDPEGEDDAGRWRFKGSALGAFPLTRGVACASPAASPHLSGTWAFSPSRRPTGPGWPTASPCQQSR